MRYQSLMATACGILLGATATTLWAQVHSGAEIQAGSRLYVAQCTLCHGQNGDGVAGVNLPRQQFRRPLSDEELRQDGLDGCPGEPGMPPFTFQQAELDGLVALIRAGFDWPGMAVKVGEAGRGQALSKEKALHDLPSRAAGARVRARSERDRRGAGRPSSAARCASPPPDDAHQRSVRIVTRDGRTIRGRRLNEDTYTVQLIDEEEHLVSLDKADIRELRSAEPPRCRAGKLSGDDLSDVIAYLLSLRGPSCSHFGDSFASGSFRLSGGRSRRAGRR